MSEETRSGTAAPEATTRRDFLLQGMALAAGAAAITSAACASGMAGGGALPVAAPRASLRPGEPVRIGVIGTGGMGTEHCRAFLRLKKDGRTDMRIAGLADVCQLRLEAAQKIVEEGQGEPVRTYTDHDALLADPTLHGVLIASPEHWHAPMAEHAIAMGKDVYVEKPMTLRLDAAFRLSDVARRNPEVIVQVGTQYVMIPSYIEAKRLIAEGAIGKPVTSQTSYCRNSKDGEWLYYEIDEKWEPGVNLDWRAWCGPLGERPWSPDVYARWRRYRDYSTGIIGDLLVHRITPLMMALDVGWPVRVVASGGHYVDKAMENHDQVNLNIEFEREHTMIVAGSTANELGLETVIRGHRANLFVGGRTTVLRPERIYAEEIDEQTIEGPDQGDSQDMLRVNWIDCIRSRQAPASPVDLGLKCMVIVDLATRSLWDGRAFGFDPATRKVRAL
ncbi:MAG: Gfo/Idh/MocA family oxidoreductase [Gemmatimonadetes bacterium]|nr:Gfo/Idh/MocA family oxidoreductase [Gemmatimonadota bacterium]